MVIVGLAIPVRGRVNNLTLTLTLNRWVPPWPKSACPEVERLTEKRQEQRIEGRATRVQGPASNRKRVTMSDRRGKMS